MSPDTTSFIPPAEEAALRAEIDDRRAKIQALEKGLDGAKVRNRRYVVDIDWPYQNIANYPPIRTFAADDPTSAPYGLLSAPFVVDQNTRFYAKQVSFTLLAVGSLVGAGGVPTVAANVVVPAVLRGVSNLAGGYGCVNFRWKVRSTGSDRDWQNQFLPDWLLQSGSRNGLRFRRGQYCLAGGSEVTVTVAPVRADLTRGEIDTGLSSVSFLRFQFVFGGVEVES